MQVGVPLIIGITKQFSLRGKNLKKEVSVNNDILTGAKTKYE
jgi:hypothetical protein